MSNRFWHRFRTQDESAEFTPASEDPELREIFVRTGFRVAAGFAIIFGLVYFAFWWSGAAVGFGASRASGQAQPTWHVKGMVRNITTREPVPWALVEDDPGGRAPYFHADASYSGEFDLITLAEPHRVRASAPGYETVTIHVGRTWFLWLPKGSEQRDIYLQSK